MTNAELIAKIRAEIERRIELIKPRPGQGQGYILCREMTKMLQSLLAFLDTLPKQPVTTITKSNALFDKRVENCDPAVMKEVSDNVDKMLASEDLEEEIKRWIHAQRNNGRKLFGWIDMVELAARHFAEWGAQHLKR